MTAMEAVCWTLMAMAFVMPLKLLDALTRTPAITPKTPRRTMDRVCLQKLDWIAMDCACLIWTKTGCATKMKLLDVLMLPRVISFPWPLKMVIAIIPISA